MTFTLGSVLLSLFGVGWFFYRLLIKRDLSKHLEELRFGVFVLVVWGLVWWFLLS